MSVEVQLFQVNFQSSSFFCYQEQQEDEKLNDPIQNLFLDRIKLQITIYINRIGDASSSVLVEQPSVSLVLFIFLKEISRSTCWIFVAAATVFFFTYTRARRCC